jgi:DNA-binding response OmpR family regulator
MAASTRKSFRGTERTASGSAIVPRPRDLAVLLVDADRAARIPLAHRLSDRYAVYEAEDGLMALRLASMIPNLAVVLCEVTVPTLDGPDLARVFRDHALLKHIPFVFLSDRASPNDVLRLVAAGAHDVLKKSLAPQTIVRRVGKITRGGLPAEVPGSCTLLAR